MTTLRMFHGGALSYLSITLQYFQSAIVLAEELHFHRAALRLRVAQPALSKQIHRIEEELEVALFARNTQKVELTDAGRTFVREASKTLAQAERTILLTKQAGKMASRVLSMGYSPRIDMRVVSVVRGLLLARDRNYHCVLVSLETPDQIEALLKGKLQFGLITLPAKRPGIVVRPLFREKLAVVVADTHPLAAIRDLSVKELSGLPVISMRRITHPQFHDKLYRLFKRHGYVPSVVQEVTTEAEALYMVREGFGITFLKPSALLSQSRGLVCCRLRESFVHEDTAIAYRRHRSLVVQECVAAVRSQIGRFDKSRSDYVWNAVDGYADKRQMNLF